MILSTILCKSSDRVEEGVSHNDHRLAYATVSIG